MSSRPLEVSGWAQEASDDNLHLTRADRKRHSLLGPHLQALLDRFPNVGFCFRLGLALADTAGDGRAFGNDDAVLVLEERDEELHDLFSNCRDSAVVKASISDRCGGVNGRSRSSRAIAKPCATLPFGRKACEQ